MLRRALERARAGDGSTHLIVGPAGIGKSALLEVVGTIAREDEALVLSARASELDHGFGFGIAHQLLEPVVSASSEPRRKRLFAGAAGRAEALFGGEVAGGDPEYGVLSGLYWLIANLAEERPTVLRVDDLHWADVASLRMLEFLARRVEDLPVLIVGSWRLHEPKATDAVLAAMAASPAATTTTLEPLSSAATATVLEEALGAPPADGFCEAAQVATGGNPLLLSVLAREAASGGLRGSDEEGKRILELAARGVAPAVARRLGALRPEAAIVARAAAVAGERARREDLVGLSGLDSEDVRIALGTLADVQILETGGWRYAHPLVRAAVLASIPRAELGRLHRRAARRLRERGERPAEIALHWLATDPAGDPDAVADLRCAARDAATEGATQTAVDLLRRALDEDAPNTDRAMLLLELAEQELRTFLPEGPQRMRDALAAGLQGQDAVRARAALGTTLLLTDPAAAFEEIDAAHAQATDGGLRLRLEASVLEALVFVDSLSVRRDSRFGAIRAAASPSAVELAHFACEQALAGRPADEVAALAGRAAADGALLREVGPGGATWNLLTHALRLVERPEPAWRLLVDGDRVVRERGLHVSGAFVDQAWGYWHRDFGSVARGLAHARARYDGILEAGLPISVAALAATTAENLILLDRIAEAEEIMDRPLDAARGTFVEVFALTARGLTRAMAGRSDEAEVDLRRVVSIADARGWHAPSAVRGRMRLAELLAGQGRTDEVRALTDHDIAWAKSSGARGALGGALRVRALAQDGSERLATLREAADALAGTPLRLEHGRALLDLGAALRQRGERAASREPLREALDIASRAESTWLARLVRGELGASGARPRRERVTGIESLTPSERRIADLAADGLSNREIAEALWVTRKTVEYHLSHVYAKLGIASREALPGAFAAAGHGLADETLG